MLKNPNQPRAAVAFVCPACRHKFEAEPGRHEAAEDRPWHPFAYFAACPVCDAEAGQAAWQLNLWKAHAHATGPKTPEGIAAVTKNIEGHPTPEEARITRFNAVTHGMTAKVAPFFPAKPGKYERCDGCEYLNNGCAEQIACLKQAELTIPYSAAFATRDPSKLMELQAIRAAAVQGIIDNMIRIIIQDGERLKAPRMYYDKEGACHVFEYTDRDTGESKIITEYTEHPLLKRLFEALSKYSLSLGDLGMTPKGQDETDIIKGHLSKEDEDQETLQDYQRRNTEALEGLKTLVENSQQQLKKDPVLLEYQQEEDGRG